MARIRQMTRLRAALVFIACYGGAVALARTMDVRLSAIGLAIVGAAILACVAIGARAGAAELDGRRAGPGRRPRVLVLALVTLAVLGFWSGFGLLVALLSELGGAPGELGVVAGSACLALLGAGLGALLGRRALEPSPVTRIAVGLIALALACVCVAAWVELGSSLAPLRAALAALICAAALAGPASVEAISCFAPRDPRDARGPWLAASVLSLVLGRGLGLALALRAVSAAQVFECCLGLGFIAVAVAVASSPSWRPLRKLARASS